MRNDRRGGNTPDQNEESSPTVGSSYVEGRHAVLEVLKSGRAVDKIYILRGGEDGSLTAIRAKAAESGTVVVECDRRKLDSLSVTGAHQGVLASVAEHEYASVEDMLALAQNAGEAPLLVVCDGLSDPHNLGAIIRSTGAAGGHGVIIPKRRSVGLTAVTAKAAAGALEHVPVARVANIASTLSELKEKGIWVYGTAAGGGTSLYEADLKGPTAIVIGSEGEGMGRLVSECCDFIVKIPMRGAVPSLNASAAAAVVLFEAVRKRLG